jgi:hypothetical protein
MEDFMRILKWSKMKPLRFKKGGKTSGSRREHEGFVHRQSQSTRKKGVKSWPRSELATRRRAVLVVGVGASTASPGSSSARVVVRGFRESTRLFARNPADGKLANIGTKRDVNPLTAVNMQGQPSPRVVKAPNDARNATATHKNVGGGIGAGSNRRIRRTNS